MWSLILLFPETKISKDQTQLNSRTAKDDPEWLTLQISITLFCQLEGIIHV